MQGTISDAAPEGRRQQVLGVGHILSAAASCEVHLYAYHRARIGWEQSAIVDLTSEYRERADGRGGQVAQSFDDGMAGRAGKDRRYPW